MTKNLDKEGLRSIVVNYDLFYIDLWGVVHNGIELHRNAIVAIEELLKLKKNIVLLTNAPRPKETVKEFLKEMGMEEHIRDLVFTSGEAALNYLKKFYFTKKFYHIGPHKDVDLFYDFDSLISILKNLDVFVTVSNSTAHFAGALGVPTILICPKKSSTYYYWNYEDGKTPW